MKYKTLFRLALKVLGVWLLAEGVIGLVVSLFQVVGMFLQMQGTSAWAQSGMYYAIAAPTSGLMKVVIGLYLFYGGQWIVNKAIPGNRPYCHECGYELSNLTGNTCPECGTPFKPEKSVETG